ncbi:helix-turn-helix domain-containing protein [Terricaulis sp.]|uniref:helix-turn-helix domain-containing protein n=1 Tax=Terricaulis sp. TaxID=2768686 RepID=UPI002AC3A6BA|nr:helix-turn-helix domain-containing protein [Terricaulis sp.]MDZ4690019.1 helix-turn-helix domain-containing protein [Terricaulis sp.]
MNSAQLRAARAFLDWSQSDLAEMAKVSVETIKRLERTAGAIEATKVSTLRAIEKAFEKAGVEFTNGDAPGVRLKAKR